MIRPHVSHDPCQRWGDPAVSGKGISVRVVAEQVWAGERVDVVADEYDLTRGDVLVACWHAGRVGLPGKRGYRPTRLWPGRWRGWSDQVDRVLARAKTDEDYARIPDPPDKRGTGEG